VGVVRWAEATKQRDQSDGGRRSCFVVAGCFGWWFPALVGGGRSCIRWGGKSFGLSVGAGPSFGERERERERERETTSWERVRFGKWRENLESESEMSTHPRFQRLFLNFYF